MLKAICPHCSCTTEIELNQVSTCSLCELPLIGITAYCAAGFKSCRCVCAEFSVSYICDKDSLLSENGSGVPLHRHLNTPVQCFDCYQSWGARNFVINNKMERLPFDGYFIFALDRMNESTVFHGTRPEFVKSIFDNGLLIPSTEVVVIVKSNGFSESEKDLRYVGRDIEPAIKHAKQDCILDIEYTGLIVITELHSNGDNLNLLFEKLPDEITGIQFNEAAGRAIAIKSGVTLLATRIHQSN